ncbi:MAG: AAA family ATPase [Acidobacteriota bacterium]|nr:AAA family ATPase [Acidobacteriota bacterium]
MTKQGTLLDVARSYLRRGWMPLPVPYRSKNPNFEGWQNFTVTEADLPRYFGGTQLNIGVRLGTVSGDLADVDLDCAEARALARHFLPATCAVFGRLTSPRSHWLYVAPIQKKLTCIDPISGKRLVEVLTNGQQAIFPGSTHQDTGELIEWSEGGEPARLSADELSGAARRLAAAALLAHHWPQEGSRQDAALALAGGLLRAGWSEDEAARFIGAVCEAASDEETRSRVQTVCYTSRKLESGKQATGWPTLADIVDKRVVIRACEWLGVQSRAADYRAAQGPETYSQGDGKAAPRIAPRLALTPLNDLLAEPEEEVAYVWDRTLPAGGISICAAKPKVGKSTLARNLAVAITRGEAFFGRATAKGKVIYLCLEEKRAEVAAHFRRMGAHGSDILIHTGRLPDDALAALKDVIAEFDPALVIIDPLSRFVRVIDFNDYAQMARGLEPLIDLARVTGCHILSVHHCGKGEREGGDALLGSTAIFGAIDTALMMKRRDNTRTLHTVQRYGDDMPETVAHLDPETGIVTAGGDLATLQVDERKRAVLEAMGDEWLSEPDVKERVGGNQTLTAKAIRALYDAGELQRTGAGKRGDPYLYAKPSSSRGYARAESSILDSLDIDNPENRENRESDEPTWLMEGVDDQGVPWMVGEPDEVRERAAIMEIDGGLAAVEAARLARLWATPMAA